MVLVRRSLVYCSCYSQGLQNLYPSHSINEPDKIHLLQEHITYQMSTLVIGPEKRKVSRSYQLMKRRRGSEAILFLVYHAVAFLLLLRSTVRHACHASLAHVSTDKANSTTTMIFKIYLQFMTSVTFSSQILLVKHHYALN